MTATATAIDELVAAERLILAGVYADVLLLEAGGVREAWADWQPARWTDETIDRAVLRQFRIAANSLARDGYVEIQFGLDVRLRLTASGRDLVREL
jgi:hypothetical protein